MRSNLLDRRLLLVTGKGGTGKTTVAAALARSAAARGKRVLLCEIDNQGDLAEAVGTKALRFEPHEVEPRLFVMGMDTEASLQEYLKLNLKVPVAIRTGPFARAFDFVATAAPGVREVLTIGKLCWEVKRENYDLVVADAPATGHVVSQLTSPDAIGGLVNVGPLSGQTTWMREMLSDPQRTGVVVVTTAEEIPVSETLALLERLEEDTRTPVGAVVINRTLPQLFTRAEEAVFEAMTKPEGVRTLSNRVDGDVAGLVATTAFSAELRRVQSEHLTELRSSVDASIPTFFVPQCFERLEAKAVVDQVAAAVDAEMDQ